MFIKLIVMIKCLFGKVLANKVLAIMADGHRINQKCFKMLNPDSDTKCKPWLIKSSSQFLFYDYVHVVKCIRNNWLTEKTQKLRYTFNGSSEVANWNDLVTLQKMESIDTL